MDPSIKKYEELFAEIEHLRARLREANETLDAIRRGAVDAIVVEGQDGPKVFALEGAEHPYRVLVEWMNEGAGTLGSDGTILYSNSTLAKILRTPIEKVIGAPMLDFMAPHDLDTFERLLEQARQGSGRAEILLKTGDDTVVPALLSCHSLVVRDVKLLSIVVTDITDRKLAEQKLFRLNRALTVLRDVNQLLVHCSDESVLLHEACRLLVHFGGYRMAWIGFVAEDERGTIIPVARAGLEGDYLERLQLTLTDAETSRNPMAVAIRSGQISVLKDIWANGLLAEWHEHARCQGYASLIALPLDFGGNPRGGIAIWSEEANAYDEEEIELLAQLASDLSYGIESLRARAEKERAEKALHESEQRFKAIFEGAEDFVYVKDRSLKYTQANPALAKLLGRSISQIVGHTDKQIFGRDLTPYVNDADKRVLAGESIDEEHTMSVNGIPVTFHDLKVPLWSPSGEIMGICGISRDVTDRKKLISGGPKIGDHYPSVAMQAALQKAGLAAVKDSVVLLLGESGSGKDYVARYIHEHSARAGGPFRALNCAAISAALAESELFGHERGSFTGAHARKRGLLELAEGGTLLLNEIGELPPSLQSKLLTFLDTREFTRVGGEKQISVNARLIAATNRDLEADVEAGRFRQDLFYRLNVFPIEVPPLRERREDIPILASEILSAISADLQGIDIPLDMRSITALCSYNWPGNVRELRNVLERAVILWDGKRLDLGLPTEDKGKRDLRTDEPTYTVRLSADATLQDATDQVTRLLVAESLRRSEWNKKQAARSLGIARDSLYRYMKRFGIESEDRK